LLQHLDPDLDPEDPETEPLQRARVSQNNPAGLLRLDIEFDLNSLWAALRANTIMVQFLHFLSPSAELVNVRKYFKYLV